MMSAGTSEKQPSTSHSAVQCCSCYFGTTVCLFSSYNQLSVVFIIRVYLILHLHLPDTINCTNQNLWSSEFLHTNGRGHHNLKKPLLNLPSYLCNCLQLLIILTLETLTAVLLAILVFWDMTPCH